MKRDLISAIYNGFSKILDFYIKSSIHVALAIYALLQVSCTLFNLPYSEALSYTVFYGSILGYNFIKYSNLWISNTNSFWKRPYLLFSLVSAIAMVYYIFNLDIKTISYLGAGILLVILYTIPLFQNKNLRDLSGIKIFIVALTWCITTCLSVFVHFKVTVELNLLLYSFATFLWVLCLIIPFELRDVSDDPTHLKTLPQRYGIKTTKNIGISLIFILILTSIVTHNYEINKALIIQSFIYILTLISIIRSNTKQSKYYSSFFVESLPILWWILLILF